MTSSREKIKCQIFELIATYYAQDKESLESGKMKIGVGYAYYDDKEVNHVLEALFSGWITMGREAQKFEQLFADYVGVRHAVAVNSGSSANLLALTTLVQSGDVERGTEVIVPSATFTTVVSPVIQVGLKPVFVDVDPETYNIDLQEIRKALTHNTRVIMPVHTLGYPADVGEIMRIAEEHNLKVLEDCCEAHGTTYHGQKVGSFGDLSTFSFFVAHNMTTGEGGMVVTNNEQYATILRSLREFGRLKGEFPQRFSFSDEILKDYDERYVFERMGYNVRMTDLAASFGIEQLKKLDVMNAQRIDTANYYIQELKEYEKFIQLAKLEPHAVHTYYAFPIVIQKGAPFTRAEFARYLESQDIETRALFGGSLVDQPAYRHQDIRVVGDLPVSRWLRDCLIFIGCHPKVGKAEREYVVRTIQVFLEQYK